MVMRTLQDYAAQAGIVGADRLFFKFLDLNDRSPYGSPITWEIPTTDPPAEGRWMRVPLGSEPPYWFGDETALLVWMSQKLFVAEVLDPEPDQNGDYVGRNVRLLFEVRSWREDHSIHVRLACDGIQNVIPRAVVRDAMRQWALGIMETLRATSQDVDGLQQLSSSVLEFRNACRAPSNAESNFLEAISKAIECAERSINDHLFCCKSAGAALLLAAYSLSQQPVDENHVPNKIVREELRWQIDNLLQYLERELIERLDQWARRQRTQISAGEPGV
ncbi:MAG: hypothetical protein ACLQPD_31860 [Desulfomonilaceae bacterium]